MSHENKDNSISKQIKAKTNIFAGQEDDYIIEFDPETKEIVAINEVMSDGSEQAIKPDSSKWNTVMIDCDTLDGYNANKFFIDSKTPNYYHPGKSGRIFLDHKKDKVAAYFGEIHPNILKKIDIKTENLIGFEIFLENLKLSKKTLKDQKLKISVSDFQKSERDFAFVVNKDVEAQELISVISNVNPNLISNIKVFDVYEGENIPDNQKSIAISITIQSSEKTLNDKDLEKINNSIIEAVENKTGAKIRS